MSQLNKSQSKSVDWTEIKERLKSNQDALTLLFSSGAEKNKLIFQERAKRMADRVRRETHSDTVSVMTFQLGKECYCLPISELAEVIPFIDCTPIPGYPSELKGAITVRGEIRCVVDLAKVLGLPVQGDSESRGYILMLKIKQFQLGLLVSDVHHVLNIEKSIVESQDIILSGMVGQNIKEVGSNPIIFLNIGSVLNHPIFKDVA